MQYDAFRPEITSLHNALIKQAVRLRDRRSREKSGLFLIDGLYESALAARHGFQVHDLLVGLESLSDDTHRDVLRELEAGGTRIVSVSSQVQQRVSYGNRSDVVAIGRRRDDSLLSLKVSKQALIAVLERVEKPGNVGAVVRSADAAGVEAVIVVNGGTDIFNPNAIRASRGTIFSVPVCAASPSEATEWLARNRFRVFVARVDATDRYDHVDLRGRVAIVLGSETSGVSSVWKSNEFTGIHLPMLGEADSLNVSATAAVLFFEALRQRQLRDTFRESQPPA